MSSKKILVLDGTLLEPQIRRYPNQEQISVLLDEEVSSIPVPDAVGENDKFYLHDSNTLGRLEANVFLHKVDEGVTLFRYPDLGSTRTFVRINGDYVHIFYKDVLMEKGTYAVFLLKDFMTRFESDGNEYFLNRISHMLKKAESKILMVEVPSRIAEKMMNWHGQSPEEG